MNSQYVTEVFIIYWLISPLKIVFILPLSLKYILEFTKQRGISTELFIRKLATEMFLTKHTLKSGLLACK